MKVLMLSWEYPPKIFGGLGQHVFDLSRYLALRGAEVHVVTPRLDSTPDHEECCGVHVHRAGYPHRSNADFKAWTFYFNGGAIRTAVRLMNQGERFDIVHAHDWLAAYAGRSLASIFNIPLVTTLHATERGRSLGLHTRFQQEINEVERCLARESGLIICCSRFMAGEIQAQFDVPAERIRIIPNGVDGGQLEIGSDKPPWPDGLPWPEGPAGPVLLFLGRLVHEKGVRQLLDAFCQVHRHEPRSELFICGQGPEQESLQERARFLGIEEAVHFTGFISAPLRNELYHQASMVIIPSLYEPFGIVALEAMATGRPVIASDTGGLAEIIINGYNGLKVPPGDVNDLAETISGLLEEPGLARRLCGHAWETAETLYRWEAIAERTLEVYGELAGRQRD